VIIQRVDMWSTYSSDRVARCVTTNGGVRNDGNAIMGAGVALKAKQLHPGLPKQLAQMLQVMGNHTFWFPSYKLFTFPTKHENPWADSDPLLIEQSARELTHWLNKLPHLQTVYLPKPGCGNGKLLWADVEPILDRYLDERVVVVEQ